MNKEEIEILEKFKNKEPRNYEEVIRELKHKNITDIVITRQAYIDILVNLIDKLQKKNEQSQEILSSIKIAYMVHTKDCELLLKDIKKWEKMLDK